MKLKKSAMKFKSKLNAGRVLQLFKFKFLKPLKFNKFTNFTERIHCLFAARATW